MAWSVDNIYSFTKWLTNKNAAGGVSATDLFYAWNSEQSAYQADLLGRFQNRNNGKTGNNTGLILNETILTKLLPFTLNASLTITAGVAPKPADFEFGLALRIAGVKVTKINHGQKTYASDSVLDPPSTTDSKYYVMEYLNEYHILPTGTTGPIDLDYIAAVTDVVWGYNIVSGRQEYDAASSVQPLWDQNSIVEITRRALKSMGVHYKDQDFAQFGQSNVTTGD